MALDPAAFQQLSGFRYALRRFLAASESLCRASGLTMQQYQVLLAIKARQDGEMSVSNLADQLLLTHHAAVQMVDRLAAAGMARRQGSERDRRMVLLELTEAGDELVEALAAQHLEEILRQEPLLRRSLEGLRKMRAAGASATATRAKR
jgi:DNA-binding MarR family transcriptional regulator